MTNKVVDRKVVLVTGASQNLGYETVKALLQSTQLYHVFLGCLYFNEGEAAVKHLKEDVPDTRSVVEALHIDVSSDDSIAQCFEKVNAVYGRLDVLINNAGVSLQPSATLSMRAAWNKCYDVNVVGSQIVTFTFAPLLIRSSDPRLIFVASGLSCLSAMGASYKPISDPMRPGWPKTDMHPFHAYRASKTALNMVMLEWHWQLREDGVKTWGVSPGVLKSDIMKPFIGRPGAPVAQHPSVGAKVVASVVEGQRDDDVGKVVLSNGIQPF